MSSQSVDPIGASDTRLLARVWDWAGQAVKPIDAAEIARQAAATQPRATGLRRRLTGAQATASAVAGAHREVGSRSMFTATRLVAAAAIVALAAGGLLLAGGQGPSPVPTDNVASSSSPSANATPTPARLRRGSLPAGTYVTAPFAQPGSDACLAPPEAGCSDLSDDDAIGITFTVPVGWSGYGSGGIYPDHHVNVAGVIGAPDGAGLLFVRGGPLYSDPCHDDDALPDIPVGPTAADFADALAAHQLLDVTTPVDVTLAGYTGRSVDLQTPDNSECYRYRPWELGFRYGSLASAQWHLWILDVDGLRVVIQAMDHAGTSPELKAQLRAIVDSISIEPTTAPAASSSPGQLAWTPASAEQEWPAPVRSEPGGDPVVVPLATTSVPDFDVAGVYADPAGDIGSPDLPSIDIQSVTVSGGSVFLGIAAGAPTPPAGSNEPWIAYGLVLDTDADGVADLRLGMDMMSANGEGDPHVWRTDLHTGRTESGSQVGPVWLCDCSWPGLAQEGLGATAKMHHALGSALGKLGSPETRFYAWASVIQDGRVVATDYAPDNGWLENP